MNDLVSIIMPVYNVERYIGRCIDTVIGQSYPFFELLVVDDGSTDNSIRIAERYDDRRIKILSKTNGGLSDARNHGLAQAKGTYVYFIDSDDWIESNLLEVSLNAIKKNDSPFVVFGYVWDIEDKDNITVSSTKRFIKANRFIKSKMDLKLNSNDLNILGYAWNKVYKKSFLAEQNAWFVKGVSLVEDILFNCEVFRNSDEILIIEDVLYHYMDRPALSLIKTFHKHSFALFLKKNNELEKFLIEWGISGLYLKTILANSLFLGFRYSLHNLISYGRQMSVTEQRNYLKSMTQNIDVRNLIPYYNPTSLQDIIFKYLVKYKLSDVIFLISKIIK